MPRIKLEPQDSYSTTFTLTVRTTDLNYGGHLGNDRVLSLVHEARVAFLAEHGWSELACGGASLIMGDAVIAFRAEAFAGDKLIIETVAVEPGRSGFRLCHRIKRCADDKVIALVETGLICFDYQERKVQTLPPDVAVICHQSGD